MAKKLRIEKGNSDDLGFAYECLISEAVTFQEFKEWIYYAIEIEDEVPTYLFDILDLENQFDFKPLQIIGFALGWNRLDLEADALDGIGHKRRSDCVSDAVSREDALKALEENPHIEKRFRETFPFIEW